MSEAQTESPDRCKALRVEALHDKYTGLNRELSAKRTAAILAGIDPDEERWREVDLGHQEIPANLEAGRIVINGVRGGIEIRHWHTGDDVKITVYYDRGA